MILTHEVSIDASIDRVWLLFNELESVVPCMPGAAYDGLDGDDHKVSMKVKIGAITTNFKGTARFIELDSATHTAVIRGAGKDSGGKGAAAAMVTAKLDPVSPTRTRVVVETDLSMTGPLAQFGSGVIADIASVLISQFTSNLHRKILTQSNEENVAAISATGAVAAAGEDKSIRAREQDPADLGSVVGSIALKYAFRWIAVPLVFFVLGWLVGRSY